MPEPRETHAAIDARRNARFSDVVGKDEAARFTAEERKAHDRAQRRRLNSAAVVADLDRLLAERDALAATVARVRDLHHKGSMHFVAGECANEECDHEDVCPEEPRDVCTDCWEQAEEISPYFAEQHCPEWVMWPCATIRALDAAPSDPATDTGGEGRGDG